MNQKDIINFFDSKAPSWDKTTIRNEKSITEILDFSEVTFNKSILDIACGTGVLFDDYLKRDVSSVLGLDISPNMVEIANEKWAENSKIEVLCADAQTFTTSQRFDVIMIHNAFPHFDEPKKLLYNLSKLIAPNGRLTVAHSMSREDIDKCHKGITNSISVGLMHENELKKLMSEFLQVDTVISDDHKYIVSGKKM